jgi:AAT family amino acid transporter/GABA permease
VVTAFFSLNGAEIATIAAAESSESARGIANMATSVVIRIAVFYVGSIFLIVSVVPWTLVRVGESPFALALTTMHFTWSATALRIVILTAVLSCLNSAYYVCSRLLLVLAQHGDAPRWLAQLNSRKVPARSVWIGTAAGVAGILAAILAPQTVFAFLVNASAAVMLFVYIIIALSQISLRKRRDRCGARSSLPMWLFPWASYAAVVGMAGVLLAMLWSIDHAKELYFSLFALAVVIAAFYLKDSRRQRTDPIAYDDRL